MGEILITGASGNVGGAVARALAEHAVPYRTAERPGFDFTDPTTWAETFAGVRELFLVRSPALGNVRRDLLPAVSATRDTGVRHVVFLSLQRCWTRFGIGDAPGRSPGPRRSPTT